MAMRRRSDDERRTRRSPPGTAAPSRSGARLAAYDFFQLVVIQRLVVRRLVHLGDLEPCLDGCLYRLRKLFNVPLVCIQGVILGIGLRVEISRTEDRLPA